MLRFAISALAACSARFAASVGFVFYLICSSRRREMGRRRKEEGDRPSRSVRAIARRGCRTKLAFASFSLLFALAWRDEKCSQKWEKMLDVAFFVSSRSLVLRFVFVRARESRAGGFGGASRGSLWAKFAREKERHVSRSVNYESKAITSLRGSRSFVRLATRCVSRVRYPRSAVHAAQNRARRHNAWRTVG